MRAKKRATQASKADVRIDEDDLPFKLGDQVLCRYSTYPYWPATVDTSHQAKARGKYYLVEQHPEKGTVLKFWCTFANEDTGGWVRVNRMVRFHPQLADKIRVDRAHDYYRDQISAIEAAIKDFERFGGGEVPDVPADFENGGDDEDDEDDVDEDDLESADEEEGEQAVEKEKKKARGKNTSDASGGKGEKRKRRRNVPATSERPKKRTKEDENRKEDAAQDENKGLEKRLKSAYATIAKLEQTLRNKENEIAEMTEGKNPVRVIVPPSPEGVDIEVPRKEDFRKKKMAADRFSKVMNEIKSDFELFKSIVKEVDSSRTALDKEKKKAQERFAALVTNVTTAEKKAAKKEKSLCENLKKILEADIEVEALREHKAGNYIKTMGRQCKDMRVLNEFCNSIYDTWKIQVKAWTGSNQSSAGGKSAPKDGKGHKPSKTDKEGDVVMTSGDVEKDGDSMPAATQGNGVNERKDDKQQDDGGDTPSAKKSRKTKKDSRPKDEKASKSDANVEHSTANGSQQKVSNVMPDAKDIVATASKKDSDAKPVTAKGVNAKKVPTKKAGAEGDVGEETAKDTITEDIGQKDDATGDAEAKDAKADGVDKSAEAQDTDKKTDDAADTEMKDAGTKETSTKGSKDRKRRTATKRKGNRGKDASEEAEAKGTVGKGKQRKDSSAGVPKGKDLDSKKRKADLKVSESENPDTKGAQAASSRDTESDRKDSDGKKSVGEGSGAKTSGVEDSRNNESTGMKDPGKKDVEAKDSKDEDLDVKDSEAQTSQAEDSKEKKPDIEKSEDKDHKVDSKDKESSVKDSKSKESHVRASRASKSGVRDAKRKDAGKDKGSGAGGSKHKDSGVKGRKGKSTGVKSSTNEHSDVKDSDVKEDAVKDSEKDFGNAKAPGDDSEKVAEITQTKDADVKPTQNKGPGARRGKKADMTAKGGGSKASDAKSSTEIDTKSSQAVASKSKSHAELDKKTSDAQEGRARVIDTKVKDKGDSKAEKSIGKAVASSVVDESKEVKAEGEKTEAQEAEQ